jgi:lysine/ornithine N-monooxygenase
VLEYVDENGSIKNSEPFDYVFVASGYQCAANQTLLAPLENILRYSHKRVSVDSTFKVRLSPNITSADCGIWLASGFEIERRHVFTHLATKTKEILNSVLDSASIKPCIQKQKGTGLDQAVEYARL